MRPSLHACAVITDINNNDSIEGCMPIRLKRSTKRLLALLALLPAAVFVLGTIYMVGMDQLEGSPRTFLESLQWASETLTTTGYGNDSHWRHPVVALFVILGQFLGQFLVFLVFPVFVLPFFEEQFEVRLQHILPPMEGKVLFYRYGPAIESLLEEFKRRKSPFVIFEEDLQTARHLRDRGYNVVFGNLGDDPAVLQRAVKARAVIMNAGDHANATCTLIVREHGFTGPVYALADEPLYRAPMVQIGATEVFTPAHVLGGALASRASARISLPVEGLHLLGAKIGMAEFRIRAGSVLAGQRLGDLHLRQQHGVSVIGQWHGGRFATAEGFDTMLEPGAILVVVGAPANLEKIERMAMPIRRTGPIVVAGFGTVGAKVVQMLNDAEEPCTVIDRLPAPGVHIVGNVLELATLEKAKVREASAVILALAQDSEAVFATAVVRDYAPEIPLIVRVNRAHNTERLYRAGADFAISQGQVAGQILAYHLLDEQAVPVENRIKFSRMNPGQITGWHPWRHEVLERTGAKIIAVERNGDVLVEFEKDFEVAGDDTLFVCGTADNLERFQREFQASPQVARPAGR
ncbi:potassium channel family protein [Propionivibrio soli]|uniref:potassium channel family protein n=1 Tax=Propionivibrio soli TaxID=2976531 RepID=UPI0021E7980B|nr:NAD-binding protein [Propionivibrio soli]